MAAEEAAPELEETASASERPPWRPTAIVFALVILAIVWMSYHYTGAQFEHALKVLTSGSTPDSVKDATIQLLSAVAQSMVAVAAVTGLVGHVGKLVER